MQPEQLGPYRIVRSLGQGGMGAVYEGVHEETGESVAVKVLAASLGGQEGFRQRFEAEIGTLKMLRHPNVVRLFGFGEQDGTLFYTMEIVEGHSIEKELRDRRQFRWPEAVEVGIAMCQALRHAHDRGIIHRDIKPANILLTDDDHVKIVDFGIARLFGGTGLTVAGSVLGTVEFMAPEQADGRPVGIRADLYSMGGVIYALLAGRAPFLAKSIPEMLEKQRSAIPVPVGEFCPSVPEPLEAIVAKLLEKAPEDRFSTADVVRRRLEEVLLDFSHADSLHSATLIGGDDGEDSGDFELSGMDVTQAPSGEQASDLNDQRTIDTDRLQPLNDAMDETQLTDGLRDLPESPLRENSSTASMPDGSTHFTTVDEHELDSYTPEEEEHPATVLISIQTWMLVISLVILGLAASYMLRPPTADALHEEIRQITREQSVGSYRRAEDEIGEFITRFPTDARRDELRGYLLEIELSDLEKRFENSTGRFAGQRALQPVERAYRDAIGYAKLDPEIGILKLQAVVDVFGRKDAPEGSLSGVTRQTVELARRRLERLESQVEAISPDAIALIYRRLDAADELQESDPEQAQTIRHGVLTLYESKPWAAEAVQRAKQDIALAGDPATREASSEPQGALIDE